MIYRPIENLTLSMSYALLTNFHTRAIYRIGQVVERLHRPRFRQRKLLARRPAGRDQRFFYYNDRLSAGSQVVFSRNVLLQISGGYIFDRFYFEGTSFTDQNFNRVRIGAGAFLEARIQVRF